MRKLSFTDHLIAQGEQALRTCYANPPSANPYPAKRVKDTSLDESQRQHAGGLMRINHVGEVCAQALYYGQAATAKNIEVRHHMLHAAGEESDHLNWCNRRLKELKDRPSLLNPLWYGASYGLGAVAGVTGDPWSLGFVTETERQVEAHLVDHLEKLPPGDHRSRAIVTQMAEDEAKHAREATQAGGRELPDLIKNAMAFCANIMRAVAYRI